MEIAYTISRAAFSGCLTYRYTLERGWRDGGLGRYLNFLMLNPSTADEIRLDPTVTRCVGYARRWGYDGLVVTNIFALRSTDPRRLREVEDPVGPHNDEHIQRVAKLAALVVCAWGTHGAFLDRGRRVVEMLTASENTLHCLGVTKDGHPRHPLYLRGDAVPVPLAALTKP
jgi:hypothetical protein